MDPDLVSWVMFDENRQGTQVNQGSLDEVAEFAAGNKVIVLVPGDEVQLNKASIPTQNRKRIATALPFALEDQLISDIDELHFAIGERDEQGDVACAIVAHEKMARWVNQLLQFGIHANFVIPDILALPYIDNAWTLLVEDNEIMIRTGKQSGMVMEASQTMDCMQLLLDENEDSSPEQIIVYRTDDSVATGLNLEAFGLPVTEDVISNGILPFIHGLATDKAINLLQGEYSRKEQMGKIWRPWIPAAAMLGGLVLLQLVMTTTEYFQLKSRSENLKSQIEQTFRTAFPESRNIVNPRVQMEQKLKELRGGSGLDSNSVIGLLNGSAPVLSKTGGLVIRSVRYKEGSLDVDLIIGDLQSLDKLKQQLISQGRVSVDIVSANSRDNKVESRLKIAGAKS